MDDACLRDWDIVQDYKARRDFKGLTRYNRSMGFGTNFAGERFLKWKDKKMTDKIFVDGMTVKSQTTQYGEIIKLGCKVKDLTEFLNGFRNERGYVNIDILHSKEGKPYAVVNTYKSEPAADANVVDTDEVPF